MLNVRLDKETEKKLDNHSYYKNLSKTAIVKEALAMYFSKETISSSPFELGEGLFGQGASGRSDASTQYKSILKDKIREKHSH